MTTCLGFAAHEAHSALAPFRFERRALRADDVAIDIAYCGVCHSDAHQVHNDWNNTVYPIVPGHEIVGHVTAVGRNVSRFKVGDRVAVGCQVDSCLQCAPCAEHQEQLCVQGPTPTYNGKDRHTGEVTYGGYSEHIVVREQFVLRMPERLDPRFAAPLLCAGITVWNPMRRYGVGKGSKVAVVGLGGLGHMAVKLAVALGAEVTVITTSPGKADDARALGATSRAAVQRCASDDGGGQWLRVHHRHHSQPAQRQPLPDAAGSRGRAGAGRGHRTLEPIHGGLLIRNNRSIAGSLIGGIQAIQELLDFCAEHQVLPSCEMIDIKDINTAFDRLQNNDVKYRFVIDMTSLRDVVL